MILTVILSPQLQVKELFTQLKKERFELTLTVVWLIFKFPDVPTLNQPNKVKFWEPEIKFTSEEDLLLEIPLMPIQSPAFDLSNKKIIILIIIILKDK